MAKIVIVHGIGNQYAGEMQLRSAWHPALCDGLHRAKHLPLPAIEECTCPFYGDLFRGVNHLSLQRVWDDEDVNEATADEARLLDAVWRGAVDFESDVPGLGEQGDTLLWVPRSVERALNALAKSKYLANCFPLQFFGDLKQVAAYLNDRVIHEQILARVLAHIGPETRLVIGHSLGSIIAYEALCAKPVNVSSLITLGSPLGIRNVVFDKLTPPPEERGSGCWPGSVRDWTNVAASGDIVAAQKTLAPLFGNKVKDVLIDSGWDAHSSTRYLNVRETGEAVALALRNVHPFE